MSESVEGSRGVEVAWRPGWVFGVSLDSLKRAWSGPAMRFRTLRLIGDIGPYSVGDPAWCLSMGLVTRASRPHARLRSDGFDIDFVWEGRVCHTQTVIVAPGVLAGVTDAPLLPSLLSNTKQVSRTDEADWLDFGSEHVVLLRRAVGNLLRFVLAVGDESHSAVMDLAKSALDENIGEFASRARAWRTRFYERTCDLPFDADRLCGMALESFLACFEVPTPDIPYAWCATSLFPRPRLNVDELYTIVSGCLVIDPRLAIETIRLVVSLQNEQGGLPHSITADGQNRYDRLPLPLVAQSVRRILGAQEVGENTGTNWVTFLRKYLMHAIAYWDPSGSGRPQATASRTGDEQTDVSYPVALPLLLLAEIEAYEDLARVADPANANLFASYATQLAHELDSFYWDSKRNLYVSRTASGEPAPTFCEAGFLAFSCRQLVPTHKQALLHHAEKHWAQQGQWRVPSWSVRLLVLDALRASGSKAFVHEMALSLWRQLHQLIEERMQTPLGTAEWMMPAEECAAVLCLCVSPKMEVPEVTPRTTMLERCNQLAVPVVTALVAFPLMCMFAVGAGFMLKQSAPRLELLAVSDIAHRYYQLELYDDALKWLDHLRELGGVPSSVLLGNIYFRQGDLVSAEKWYRSSLGRAGERPSGLLNLAAVLYKQRRYHESAEMFESFLAEYEAAYPSAADRARYALRLVRKVTSASGSS